MARYLVQYIQLFFLSTQRNYQYHPLEVNLWIRSCTTNKTHTYLEFELPADGTLVDSSSSVKLH